MIFDIQRFAIHDGSGIRTLVFFKGCPLSCQWCDNPEGQSPTYELMWDKRLCMGCGDCAAQSKAGEITFTDTGPVIHREKRVDYRRFNGVCPTGALNVIGEERSVQEIVEEIKKDMVFYQKSNGGVTLSGGEPFMQPEFLYELLIELKRLNIHTAIETSLHAKWQTIEKSISLVDSFLADLKHIDKKKFKEYTGGNLSLILDNFYLLAPKAKELIVRIPVIPSFNSTKNEIEKILDFTLELKTVHTVNLIPYHTLGVGKYELLGRTYSFHPNSSLSDTMLREFCKMAQKRGLNCHIGG